MYELDFIKNYDFRWVSDQIDKWAIAQVIINGLQTGDKPLPEPMMTQVTNAYVHQQASVCLPLLSQDLLHGGSLLYFASWWLDNW